MRRVYALSLAAVMAGCGGFQSGIPAGGGVAARPSSSSASGDLLYVAHVVSAGSKKFRGEITVLTFPGGKPFATIALDGYATGVCSDDWGNVWAVVHQDHRFDAYEFAHGGSKPIAKISIERAHQFSTDCAVDPTTGNLAVLVGAVTSGSAMGQVEIWAHARQGKPAIFPVPFTPTGSTYDASGDLFVDGWIGSTVLFELGELAKGSRSFGNVTLDRQPANYPGGIRWDGTYVDVVDNNFSDDGKIYRVDVSNYQGHVAGIVRPKNLNYAAFIDIHGATLAGTAGYNGSAVSVWAFPGGGKSSKTLARFKYGPRALAISVGSH